MTIFEYRRDWRACRKFLRVHNKSYKFITRFFPVRTRRAVEVLYAFVCLPEGIVDNPILEKTADIKKHLEYCKEIWKQAYDDVVRWSENEKVPSHWIPVLRASAKVFHEYGIPYKFSEEYFAAAIQDTEKSEYQTYSELEKHMYGSSATVCLMMTFAIGFTDKRALLFAEELGYAIQLTSVLKDIRKDLEERGGMYLPKAERDSFGITKESLLAHTVDETFARFMGFQMSRARALYVSADEGISFLREDGRFSVRLFAAFCEATLDEIERNGCDVFTKKPHSSLVKNMKLAYGLWRAEKTRR